MDNNNTFVVQSADIIDETVDTGETTSQILTFVDNSTGLIDDIGNSPNPIASASSTTGTSLGDFLSRPTLIDARTWTTASTNGILGANIEPWYQYLNNSVIKNKLQNYAFLRAKLCIKIVVNATPFHYGLMRVAYEPNVNAANTGDRTSKIRTNLVSPNPYLVPFSQLPGTWVIPADNSGGEIHVPFFRYSNFMPLNVASAAKTMGVLSYYVAFPLTVASSSGSTSITIDTFAWLEDVELCGSTAELTLQAKDEYDGPISHPASAIASVSKRLENVPIIGKFARATTIGATAIRDVAAMFGFTNTPVIDSVHAMIPSGIVHMASAEISTPVQKFTLDPKQELSIDPTLHGVDSKDDLAISNFISRKSALVVDGWSTADAVGTVIFNSRVNPAIFSAVSIVDAGVVSRSDRVYHTPLSYMNMIFQHWRGDIIFEFEVICTKFHKGRLKIGWDPLGSSGTTALAENTVYTTILDIGENNKAAIRVPYHQAYAFMRTRTATNANNWSVGNSLPTDPTLDNGLLIVSVLTPLMSPVSPQNVGVMVSIRAADNLEFANPRGDLGSTQPPSFFAVQAKDEVDLEAQEITFGDKGSKHPHRYDLNFGERCVSLRNLLHRYSFYDTSSVDANAATRTILWVKSFTRLPPSYGYDPNGKYTANKILAGAGTANFNYAPTHPITYVLGPFGAFRGGINYIMNSSCDLYPYIGDIRVTRLTSDNKNGARQGVVASTINTGTTKSAYNRYLNTSVTTGLSGTAITNTQTNAMLNWQAPMLTGTNFQFTDPTYSILGNTPDQSVHECTLAEVVVKQSAANTVSDMVTFNAYAGTAPDFTALWFLCCPTLDYYTSNPIAP